MIDKVPYGHWKTTTLIAALDIDGIRCSNVVDGAVNADIFEAFVEQTLVPNSFPAMSSSWTTCQVTSGTERGN